MLSAIKQRKWYQYIYSMTLANFTKVRQVVSEWPIDGQTKYKIKYFCKKKSGISYFLLICINILCLVKHQVIACETCFK